MKRKNVVIALPVQLAASIVWALLMSRTTVRAPSIVQCHSQNRRIEY